MSRGLALAEQVMAGKKPSPSQLAALTPAERQTFELCAHEMFGRMPGSGRVSWSPELLKAVANVDAGGVLTGVREAHAAGLAHFLSSPPAGTPRRLTMSLDTVSSGHVCTADVSALTETTILALKREAVNTGKFVSVVNAQPCFRVVGVTLLVRDSEGTDVPLALYHCTAPHISKDDLWAQFPVGARIIVKEPYLKITRTGSLGLRVDNPCNIIVHRPAAPAKALTAGSGATGGAAAVADTAAARKDAGNAFFARGHFAEAVDEYTAALALSPDEPLRLALHKNRAASFLKLGRWEAALADADAALAIDARDEKALFRRHSALVELGRYKQALTTLDVVCKPTAAVAPPAAAPSAPRADAAPAVGGAGTADVGPKTATDAAAAAGPSSGTPEAVPPEFSSARAKVVTALAQSRGDYDFMTLPWTPQEQAAVAPYYGPIEIKQTAGKGWGLFVTRDVPAGTLLLAEPALAFALERPDVMMLSHDAGSTVTVGAAPELRWDLILQSNSDDDLRSKLALLAHDKRGRDASTPIPSMDDVRFHRLPVPATPLSAERVAGIVSVNVFSFTVLPAASKAAREGCVRVPATVFRDAVPDVRFSPRNIIMFAVAEGRCTPDTLRAAIAATPAAERVRAINEGDAQGITALMIAVSRGKPDLVAVLISEGAAVNTQEKTGMTALHMACGHAFNLECVKLLLAAKANPNLQMHTGSTPLMAAVFIRQAAAVELLMAAGADPYVPEFVDGRSPACLAFDDAQKDAPGMAAVRAALAKHGAKKPPTGSALWFVASFMNHSSRPTSHRRFIGKFMFVRAGRDMRKGDEVTTLYFTASEGASKGAQWGIKGGA